MILRDRSVVRASTLGRCVLAAVVAMISVLGACKKDGKGDKPKGSAECKLGAVKPCLEQCEAGKAESCHLLGQSFQQGEPRFSHSRAVRAYLKGCNLKHAPCCKALSFMLSNEHYKKTFNNDRAAEARKKACEAGDEEMCVWATTQKFQSPEDKEAAYKKFEARCKEGKQRSCTAVAWMHQSGHHVAKDEAKAAEMVKALCDKGEPEACLSLGKAFFHGWGVKEDKAKGLAILQKACDAGRGEACLELDENQEKTPAGVKKRLELLAKACDSSYAAGCSRLGDLYLQGEGEVVAKDPKKARQYLMKACLLGFSSPCKTAELMEKDK